ncbi:hypothetical protein ATO6_13740 [Oceanicola sp. 22II-s10i]|uniref:GFA family protein n=1 Tax=Oceanicola sp. 22II-s10i TaxID=1317116 RepID=UPI000B526ECC|nr:GFA family protein [Oceanicola sp. 22II-s10i]OWU84123.1 hypothetical protein ATO6_13740 [Oceanicola sp. 22II-s10i]
MHVTGHCHCGAIRFEAEIDPAEIRICHCTDCQRLSGSAFRVNVFADDDRFRLLGGSPKSYVKIADSGNRRLHAFCADCGTPVYATSEGPGPKRFGLRVGTLDNAADLIPSLQIWTRSALPWLGDIGALPGHEGQ